MITELYNIDPNLLEEDERIAAYLKGQMSEAQEDKFLKDLEGDAQLKEKTIMTARLVKGMKEVGQRQDNDIYDIFLASSEEDAAYAAQDGVRGERCAYEFVDYDVMEGLSPYAEAQEAKKARRMRNKFVIKCLAVAASLVFIVWMGVEYGMYKYTIGLAERYGAEFSSEAVARGADSQSDTERKLAKLFDAVKKEDNLDETISELTVCWKLSTKKTYNDYTDYSAEIGWNLVIAYLKNDDRDNARKVLQKLVETSEEGSVVNKKSKQLLEKLYF